MHVLQCHYLLQCITKELYFIFDAMYSINCYIIPKVLSSLLNGFQKTQVQDLLMITDAVILYCQAVVLNPFVAKVGLNGINCREHTCMNFHHDMNFSQTKRKSIENAAFTTNLL